MSELIMPRRKFLRALVGLVAAPAVVKASSLMAVKPIVDFSAPTLTELSMKYSVDKENAIMQLLDRRLAEAQLEMVKNMSRIMYENDPLTMMLGGKTHG